MLFGLTLCNHGDYADPRLLADLAAQAEATGWDGVFVWDHVARAGEPPMTDPWIALAAIACSTDRVRLGPMVTPLARRRPWKVARETVSLDHLSGGRLILGVGLGVHPEEFAMVGEAASPRERAALLDESLDIIQDLWTGERVTHAGPAYTVEAHHTPVPLQRVGGRPAVPVWVGGTWPNEGPFRRAARFQGSFPVTPSGVFAPADYIRMRAFVGALRPADEPFTLVHQGSGEPGDMDGWQAYAAVGVDWWLESFRAETRPLSEARAVIAAGPPRTAQPGQ